MIFETRRGADVITYPLFDHRMALDLDAMRMALESCRGKGKVLLVLNYPNNPTGYGLNQEEAEEISSILREAADRGSTIVAIVDDAYFSLFYEDGLFRQSIFALLADAHPSLVAVKVDGPTKEDYAWGFRVGFLTFSLGGAAERLPVFLALEKKVGGLIRGTISKASMPAQSLLIKAMLSSGYLMEKKENFELMKGRYLAVKKAVYDPAYGDAFVPYPFNSGYFMCLDVIGVSAEELRRHLLDKYGVGMVAIGDSCLRMAFSCLEREQVRDLFDILYTAIVDLRRPEHT